MKDEKVYYTFNADCDPRHLDKCGYFSKHRTRLESESGILYKDRTTEFHVPQGDLTRFLDTECGIHLTYERELSNYYKIYSISLAVLQRNANDSVFLTILLEAYNDKNLYYFR